MEPTSNGTTKIDGEPIFQNFIFDDGRPAETRGHPREVPERLVSADGARAREPSGAFVVLYINDDLERI
jgi:hypothetical protein